MDEIDLKDLQYQLVLARRKATQLITDIHNAETKNLIKTIKDIENEQITPKISYKPLDIQRLRQMEVSAVSPNSNCLDEISGIRSAVQVVRNKQHTRR